jgi:hypothetical protein
VPTWEPKQRSRKSQNRAKVGRDSHRSQSDFQTNPQSRFSYYQ